MPSSKVSKKLRKELMTNHIKPQNTPQEVLGEAYAGPIPDPETLERYNNAGPDFAERIMKMAEAHNEADVKAKNRYSLVNFLVPIIGQVFSLVLTSGGIVACVLLARAGYTVPAVASVTIGFAPVIIGTLRSSRQ